MSIQKILIANRGEIALRVIRSAREMGIRTVAVYSEADRQSLHVRAADEAYFIGPPPSKESYLRTDKILQVALDAGADAIHPGYGFLSENAGFARQVQEKGLIFIGPPPEAIEVMGSKLAAKEAVKKYDIPLVPGTEEAVTDVAEAQSIADDIGYPILIKASAGGGGKGMRIVQSREEFQEQMERAVSEAESAFGDGSVFIEKFIENPKHIEIQVLADQHGNAVYLFERECSVQRRHQKVIEEAPSAVISPELRQQMGESAVGVARSCGYTNAGTVEFIADEQLNYYFLEMNTRLQVEHPVTEEVTGLDLVKQQIKVAEGQPLSFNQEDLQLRGHAIEVRVYAEDPANNFLPNVGLLKTYRRPQGPGIRVDDGIEEGMEIPIHYDPMVAKLITYGADREEAIQRMLRAIRDFHITGVETTLPFCAFTLQHEQFRSGKFSTNFVANYFKPEYLAETEEDQGLEDLAALFALWKYTKEEKTITQTANGSQGVEEKSSWVMNRKATF